MKCKDQTPDQIARIKQAYQQGFIAGQMELDRKLRKIHEAQAQDDIDRVNDAIAQYESQFNPVLEVL